MRRRTRYRNARHQYAVACNNTGVRLLFVEEARQRRATAKERWRQYAMWQRGMTAAHTTAYRCLQIWQVSTVEAAGE